MTPTPLRGCQVFEQIEYFSMDSDLKNRWTVVDGTGRYCAELSQSVRERQSSRGFLPTWNISNSTEHQRGREANWIGSHERGRTTARDCFNDGRVAGRVEAGGPGGRGDGHERGRAMWEHWALYATDELLTTTSEPNDVLSVGYLNLNSINK